MTMRLRSLIWLMAVFVMAMPVAGRAEAMLDVPVRVIILGGLEIPKAGRTLRSWVTEADVRRVVIPEVNRLWAPAGIRVVPLAVETRAALAPPDRTALVAGIAASHRDADGESDPARIDAYHRLIDFSGETPGAVTVVLVPYLGEDSQGNTRRKLRRVLVAQWTDKGRGAEGALRRFELAETGPYRQGSLSRTVAHELGHVLGLDHPDKASQTEFGLLMGGRKPGERLTPAEIARARRKAARLD